MKRILLGVSITAMALFLLTSALALSVSLQNLHINAASFVIPVSAPVVASPMTYSDESIIGQPRGDSVRFEEFAEPDHVCKRDKAGESSDGF